MKFSANLGFLWADRPVTEAIVAAKQAGFHAVECHWPYDTPAQEVKAALQLTGLPMLGLNTLPGNLDQGENGLSALPGRMVEAQAAIDQAMEYALATDTKSIHVMAGYSQGRDARQTFVGNLNYACSIAERYDITILIEPLNKYDAPGYFLSTTDHAIAIIEQVGADNIKLMFDCYHIQLMEGDLSHKLEKLMPVIGHIQFASVPDRGPPDQGEINYDYIFEKLRDFGYSKPPGAEYRPAGDTGESLGWMKKYSRE